MPFEINSRVSQALNNVQKTPAIVVIFDGIPTEFTSVVINKYNLFDDGHLFDDGIDFDTLAASSTQDISISFGGGSSGTTTKIDYKIDPDLGFGDSVTAMKINFVDDKKKTFVKLLNDYELLGRKVRIKFTPNAPSALYPRDYITIFRGIVDEVSYEAGNLNISVSHPDQKKRQTIFIEHKTKLTDAINSSVTTFDLDNAEGIYEPILGPSGFAEPEFVSLIRIEDEICEVVNVTGNTVEVIRGSNSTSAVAHDAEAEVSSYYILQGNSMTLAMAIMLSGWNGYFVSDVPIGIIQPGGLVFDNRDLADEFGLNIGDYLSITDATNVTNNQTLITISDVIYDEEINQTTLLVNETTPLIYEAGSSAVVAFRSKYDVLPSGLRMTPDEVDVLEHERLRLDFLSGAGYLFYLKGTIENAKDFISKQIYQPIAAFSVPKNTRASVGYTLPPLPTQTLTTLNRGNVKDPEKIKHLRQLGRNFYNSILYKFDEDELEDAFNNGVFITDAESRERIPVGNKVFTIEANGLRSGNVAASAAQRRLFRYRFSAAQIQGLKTNFGQGFSIDIGDNIIIDGDSLLIPDISLGTENFGLRFFQVIQKSMDIRTGDISLVVLDTNFNENSRYGFISPASTLGAVTSDSEFEITQTFAQFEAEWTKWSNWVGSAVQVRNDDFSITATGVIRGVSETNVITLRDPLSITPSAGMIMEFSDYTAQLNENVKLVYTHITNGSADFGDGGAPYLMI